jgi:hypothetical protein
MQQKPSETGALQPPTFQLPEPHSCILSESSFGSRPHIARSSLVQNIMLRGGGGGGGGGGDEHHTPSSLTQKNHSHFQLQ